MQTTPDTSSQQRTTGTGSAATGVSAQGTARTASDEQLKIAALATTFEHALGAGQPAVYCPLWEPANLARMLADAKLSSCSDSIIQDEWGKRMATGYTVTDPARIVITNDTATIPIDALNNSAFDVKLIKGADGEWRVAEYNPN